MASTDSNQKELEEDIVLKNLPYTIRESARSSGADLLQPGQMIRPILGEKTARELVKRYWGLTVTTIKELNSYDDRNFHVKVSDAHDNPHLGTVSPDGYILKVLNYLCSAQPHIEGEMAFSSDAHKHGFKVPVAQPTLHGNDKCLVTIYTNEEFNVNAPNLEDGAPEPENTKNIVRLTSFLAGKILVDVKCTNKILHEIGGWMGKLNKTFLKAYAAPGMDNFVSLWNLAYLPQLRQFTYVLEDESKRQMIDEIIESFEKDIEGNYPNFQIGFIHGDINEQNIIVEACNPSDENTEYKMSGLIDFGDSCRSFVVFDTAIMITYLMLLPEEDPLSAAGYILAGYNQHMTLNELEMDALKTLVASRYAQSLVMGMYSYTLDPGNEYLLVTQEKGWPRLRKLWETPKAELYEMWDRISKSYTADVS